jgi:DNA-binding NarL/FixJ family response regulator
MNDSPRDPRPITVVIADDQTMVRSGLRMILAAQDGIEVVGEAADGAAAIELVGELDPDVVLMDIRMPVLDGIAATKQLTARGARSRILVLTTYAVDENVYDALRAGAAGFFAKTDHPDHIVNAVRSATDIDRQLGPGITELLLQQFLAAGSPRAARPEPPELRLLTEREREILVLIGLGRNNSEIGAELLIGEATVKTHITRIFSKLHLRDRVHAVVYCYTHALVPPEG